MGKREIFIKNVVGCMDISQDEAEKNVYFMELMSYVYAAYINRENLGSVGRIDNIRGDLLQETAIHIMEGNTELAEDTYLEVGMPAELEEMISGKNRLVSDDYINLELIKMTQAGICIRYLPEAIKRAENTQNLY